MKKILFLSLLILPVILFAQHPRGSFSGKNFVLHGEMEIVLKDGSIVKNKDKVDGTKIGKTNIDYKDVDYIHLIKTKSGYKKAHETIYKYITVKGEPQLVRVLIESPQLSYYLERPIKSATVYNQGARITNSGKFTVFLKKGDSDELMEMYYNPNTNFVPFPHELTIGKNIADFFPECPKLIQYQNDKELKDWLTLEASVYLYKKGCQEATPEEMEADLAVMKEMYKKHQKNRICNKN